MPLNERSPLIDQYGEYDDEDEEEISCIQTCFTLIFVITVIIILLLIFIPPHNHIDENVPNDVSNIPYQYILSHKSLWYFGYLIETFPVAFNDDQTEYDLFGEIVSVSTSWTFGNYEVREYHRNFTSNEITSVKTANSSLSFWMNDVHISFKTNSNNDTTSTGLIDPVTCDYKITWNWAFNGYIFRKCALANETDYIQISLVKGTTGWGLVFLSDDGDVYAVTSKTEYWWNMNRRDVDVKSYAPFPPVIPAIYTAYYDTIQRNHESHNRRHMK